MKNILKNQINNTQEETFIYNCKLIKSDFLEDFFCPISKLIMNDPVIINDGHSYEREYIIKWLKQSDFSPKTGEKIQYKNIIIPNYTLKSAINQFKEKIYNQKLNKQISKLKIDVKNGNSHAANKLGIMYRDGTGFVVKNYDKALEYFLIAEKLGNSDALVNIGNFYEFFTNPIDYNKAIEYYTKAVELYNNSDALVNLGLLYFQSIEKDINKAIDYFLKAEKLGNIDALTYLGIIHETELGENEKAFEFYNKAEKLGNFMAILILCDYYIENMNSIKVKKYIEKAAKIADYKQIMEVAQIYELRLKDYVKAKKYYKRAIELGNYYALIKIANIYLDEKNYSIAYEYYEKAIELGYDEALYDLSYFYEEGLGVEIDKSKAEEFKKKANNKGFFRIRV
jgi:TPR repeat protein